MMADLFTFHGSAASLPSLALMQAWLCVAWAMVAAALSLCLLQRLGLRKTFSWIGAGAIAAWVAVPGTLGGHYWLGLAFQAPSIFTVLLSSVWMAQHISQFSAQQYERAVCLSQARVLVGLGVVAGWVLLFDTVGSFSASVYNLGFSAVAPAVALFVLALPWALSGRRWPDASTWIAVLAVVLFLALQLPTGNVFDALLDPGLWAALHIAALKILRQRK